MKYTMRAARYTRPNPKLIHGFCKQAHIKTSSMGSYLMLRGLGSHCGECTKRDPDQRRIQLNSHTIQLPEQSQNLMAAPYYPLFPKGPGTERWVTPHYLQAPEQQQGVEVREHLQRVLMTSLHNTKQGDANNPFRIQEQPRTCKPTFGARSPLGLPASCKHLSP